MYGSKLNFEYHVRGIVSRISQRIVILWLGNVYVFVDTSLLFCCYYEFVLQIHGDCFPAWEVVAESHLQFLERQVYTVARFYPDQRFLSLCHRRRADEYIVQG